MTANYIEAAVTIARGAGEILRQAYAKTSRVDHKGVIDLVTDADHASEAHIIKALRSRFADHGIVAEESGADADRGVYRWLVDPLDGTVNFAHRQPHFAVLLALQHQDERGMWNTELSATYDPLRDELFTAGRNQSAQLNGEAISVSKTGRLIDSLLTTGFAYNRLFVEHDNHREFCRMNLLSQGVRRLGSAGLDLAYVACGRFDGFWEGHLNPWDLAAGALLITEAGGQVTDREGGPAVEDGRVIVATNGVIHKVMLEALADASRWPIGSREGLDRFLPKEILSRVYLGNKA
jgi:myo-inositol-1(or 4)-monophosphatase